jgi:hypothetical protein
VEAMKVTDWLPERQTERDMGRPRERERERDGNTRQKQTERVSSTLTDTDRESVTSSYIVSHHHL